MTKFNYNLSANPYSKREHLTADQVFYYKTLFKELVDTDIDDKHLSDMGDIESQFLKDHCMSPLQRKYVEDLYKKYVEHRYEDDFEFGS